MTFTDNSFQGVGDTVSGVTGGLGRWIYRPMRMVRTNCIKAKGSERLEKGTS